jgi:hypothetical protein
MSGGVLAVRPRAAWLAVLAALTIGCSREPGVFVDTNARAHIGMLAGTIGSRPLGTDANRRAREYLVDQLRQFGFHVRVQEADARRHELGLTARVANIIAVLPGERAEAVGLVAHYDSSPFAPGATDDALGVGVALEAARLFAARERRPWSLFVLLTDGEESGLMGAAALVTDREVLDRLRAYVNLESIGSSGNAVLFETGPGNAWLVKPWGRRAPHPRGGSYAIEIYQRLPNDTDFSILKTRDVPGLNLAPVGDSYAYHTARDTPDRLARETIRLTGENVVSILGALQEIDITQRTTQGTTFFDIGGTMGVSYGSPMSFFTSSAALLLGVLASVRLIADAVRTNGGLRWLLALAWSWISAGLVIGSMIGATWLFRVAREVYHPWYARPGRFFLLLLVVAVTVGWSLVRLGQWLPRRAHPARHPALTWSLALPAWVFLAALSLWFAPAAAYLWTLPLLAAGILLAILPPHRDPLVRLASFAVLAVAGTLWLREAVELSHFLVAVMGRLAIVTPVFVYAAVLAAAGAMVVPPLIALLVRPRPFQRPWLVTSLLLFAVAGATGWAYVAPAYTTEQPLRRHARALQDGDSPGSVWEVASVEPGLDLADAAPAGWVPTTAGVNGTSVPWGRYAFPFVFRTNAPPLGPPPARLGAFAVQPVVDGVRLTLSVVPGEPGLTIALVLPAGLSPARTSLPGASRLGRWTATFIAPPPEGISWEATFRGAVGDQLRDTRVMVTSAGVPGGTGWQRLPAWLPQDAAVWTSTATWVIPAASAPEIAPVPALR